MPVIIGSTHTVVWTPSWVTAGHSVSLTVTLPDGSSASPGVAAGDTPGSFEASVVCDQPGRYVLHWSDTTIDAIHVDIFDVWPADPRYLISVEDAAQSLRWSAADRTANLPTLALYVAAATEVIEDLVGAVLIRTVVQPADGGRTGVMLWERPSAVESVTVNGAASTGFVVNLNAAIVYADGSGGRFADGRQNVIITYRTGAASVPPSVQLAARELIRHLWQIGQQAAAGNGANTYTPNPSQMGQTRSGFAVPNRVIELCGNHYALPGMA